MVNYYEGRKNICVSECRVLQIIVFPSSEVGIVRSEAQCRGGGPKPLTVKLLFQVVYKWLQRVDANYEISRISQRAEMQLRKNRWRTCQTYKRNFLL